MKNGLRAVAFALAVISLPYLLAATAVAETVTGPKVAWNLSLWGKSRAFTKQSDILSEMVAARTGGNFTLKVHYGGALSPPKENIDGIKIGAFETAMVAYAYAPGKTPALMVLNLPFLPLADMDKQLAVQRKLYAHPAIQAELGRWNAQDLIFVSSPPYEFMGTGDAPVELAGWKGKRVRALGGVGKAMESLGAVPSSVPAPELYSSMERGLADAAMLPWSSLSSYRLHEVSKWYTTNMAAGIVNASVLVSRDALAALPPQYRKLLADIRGEVERRHKEAQTPGDDAARAAFDRQGLMALTYNEAQLRDLVDNAARPVWNEWAKEREAEGIPGGELVQLVLEASK